MRFFAVVAALVSAAAAETFTVVVGGNASLTYNPTSCVLSPLSTKTSIEDCVQGYW